MQNYFFLCGIGTFNWVEDQSNSSTTAPNSLEMPANFFNNFIVFLLTITTIFNQP